MEATLTELLLKDRRIACAVTDRQLHVVRVYGALDVLCPEGETCLGGSLLDLVPELVGSEQVLADILAGKVPRFQLSWVNRLAVDGQTLYLTIVVLPYRGPEDAITGLVHLLQDDTETGRLEQRLAQHRNELRLLQAQLTRQNVELAAANAELQRLDELKSQFVSVAAHELRSPLTSIIGYGEMLLDGDVGALSEQQREFLEITQQSADRLLAIANNLLDVTRIEAGRIDLVLEPRDLPALVAAVVAESKPQLEAKGQCLSLDVAPDLPPALCDEARATQIVGNLLSNAVKYTPDGGQISIRVALAQQEGFLQVSVADDGVGIAAEDQEKLFSRFFRAGTASLTRASGAGLGLYIIRSLVELHGGRIWFESVLDQGSTFHVTFPIADCPPSGKAIGPAISSSSRDVPSPLRS